MLKKYLLPIVVFLIIGINTSFAGWQPTIVNRIGSQSNVCAVFNTTDIVRTFDSDFENLVYPNPGLYADDKVVNRIVLGINRDCVGGFSGFSANLPYNLEVDVLVEYSEYSIATQWISAGYNLGSDACPGTCGPQPSRVSTVKTLNVKYDPSYQTTETELSFFSFEGGYDVKVTVQAIRVNGSSVSSTPNNAYLENIIAIERYRDLDLYATTSLAFTTNPLFSTEEGLVTINTAIPGAESYDIEWLFIDWYSGATQPSAQGRFAFDFRNNATRVTIKGLSYKIPIIYPEGILLFRVRANGVTLPNTDDLVSTDWFGASSGSVDVAWASGTIAPVSPTPTVYGYRVQGFNKMYTWQHSVSFAEESKKKQVISYFDGSLYNRQSVTKSNTTEAAIVGQTIYDFNGRPAVQILPTPIATNNAADHNLSYKQNFNKTNNSIRSGKNYNYQDFDVDASNCDVSKTSKLSDLSGSAQYYSSNNPRTDTHRDRIPSANGYPFSQVEYMPDNTGRIRRQGGVGDAHRLTGDDETNTFQTGNETKYYYSVPNQTDLYRLFANEAGDANRYKKNIVIDPNGQASVSYLDPMGRVVATALAGDPSNSSNTLSIGSSNPFTLTIDVIERNAKNFTDLSITAENDFVVLDDNSANNFWYRMAVPMLHFQCGENELCYDCVYDLTISITDECGNELVPLNYRTNKVGLTEPGERTCESDSIVFETSNYFQLVLNKGAYKIKRTISIDKSALNDYVNQLLASPNIADCLPSFDDLVIEEKANLDYTNCNYTCEKCTTDAATLLSEQKIDANEYAEMIEACSVFCEQTIPCDALYVQMVADMSPGGQYFDNLPQGASYLSNIASGNTDLILNTPPDNTWLNNNSSGFTNLFDNGGTPGDLNDILIGKGITGVIIENWDDVRENWDDDFAELLVAMHPEYCLYQKCVDVAALGSYEYDDDMRNTTTAAEAISKGLYNPTNMNVNVASLFPNTTNLDPFFSAPSNSTLKTNLESALLDFKVDYDGPGPGSEVQYNAWEFVDYWVGILGSDIQGCLTDYGWTLFRSMYLAKKQEQLNAFYANNCGSVSIAAGFKRRFYYDATHDDDDFANVFQGTIPGAGATQNDFDTYANTQLDNHCEKACSAYIDHWKQALAGCNLSTIQMDAVITKLLEVCQAGCDATDPMGTRYAKPGTNPSVKTFKEALGTFYVAGICDDLLIEWPRGNYHDYWAELTPYANRCSCLPGQQAPTPANTCANCGENLTYAGTRLFENVQLADKEKCKNCITCVNLAEALQSLDKIYNTTFNPDTDNKRIIMENYFNLRFSFNLTYLEYIDFMRDCSGLTTLSPTTVGDFRTHMQDYVDPQPIVNGSQQTIMGGGTSAPQETTLGGGTETFSFLSPTPSLLGGSGGVSTMSAPAGYKELDECGCNLLLQLEEQYNAIPQDPCAVGKTFAQYVNQCSGANGCEGMWGILNVNLLLSTCKNAVAKDEDNPYQTGGITWTFTQRNNLEDMVADDNQLIIPEDCGCTNPPAEDGPFPPIGSCINPLEYEYLEENCDQCTMDALDEYLDILQACVGGQFTLVDDNGVAQNATKAEIYNFLTKSRVSIIERVTGPASCPIITIRHLTHNCAFMLHEQHLSELSRTNIFDNNCWDFRTYYQEYARRNGCTPPEYVFDDTPLCPNPNDPEDPACKENPNPIVIPTPQWPFVDPPQFCNTCYRPISANHSAILDFLNDLTAIHNTSDPNSDNILTASGWDADVRAPKYLNPILYNAACSTSLKYKLIAWANNKPASIPNRPPSISFEVKDASGGAGCTHVSYWTLTFPEFKDEYRFGNIVEFSEIRPITRQNCETGIQRFLVAAKVYDPINAQVIEVKYLIGQVNTVELWEEVPEQCKQLCNKPMLPKVEEIDACTEFLDNVAETNASNRYEQQIDDLRRQFTQQYIEKCMGVYDYLHRQYTFNEYHYTLYYYDQADNLVKTVPPKGVITLNQQSIDSAYAYVANPSSKPRILPNHNYITNYKYNTLNQLVEQTTPDAGTSNFWYDKLGRIVLSQNAQQATYLNRGRRKYSYTLYDNLGRIVEAGELQTTATVTPENTADHDNWLTPNVINNTQKSQITRTYYDISPTWQTALGIANFTVDNARNRIVATCYYENNPANPQDYSHATHYSYDVLGNVKHVVQDIPVLEPMGQRYKQILYNYDLASGNVNLVSYQPGKIDQFYHYYEYDGDNKIVAVYTARNPAINEVDRARTVQSFTPGLGWQRDAKYLYYLHGPLARTELGQNNVQGTDYTYTLHGWLKSINDGLMQNAHDPGLDGNIPSVGTNDNRWFGRDAVGFELSYYHGNAAITWADYNAIGNNGHISTKTGSNLLQNTVSLYNGNISSMITTLPDKTQLSTNNAVIASPRGAVFQYDQLNRIRQAISFTNANIPNYQWNGNLPPGTIPQEWLTQYTYDAMGNLQTLLRQGGAGATDMDQLTYNYSYATPTWKNQLLHVDDSKAAGLHTEDIDDQAANNYAYDEIGNLIADVAEEIQSIEWTVYGKIKAITRTGASTKPNLTFEYNTAGQRVIKKVIPNNSDMPITTYYVRDASGNIMATYKHYYEIIDVPTNAAEERLAVEEFDIYGSSRLGILNKEVLVASRIGVYTGGTFIPGDPDTYTIEAPLDFELSNQEVGHKNYEITNHLGNVLAVVTDRKVPSVNGSNYDYFNAQITSITDYYPFGMQIEERSWTASSYRFGFQGQEGDDEVSGNNGDYLSFEYRIHDARLGRFLSVDPLTKDYPWNSAYAFAENRVIDGIELEGLEVFLVGMKYQFSAALSIGFETGLAFSLDGQLYSYKSSFFGLESNVSGSGAISVTFFPYMKDVNDAGGKGVSGGISGSYPIGNSISVGLARSSGYLGYNISDGIGISTLSFSADFVVSQTYLTPLTDLDLLKQTRYRLVTLYDKLSREMVMNSHYAKFYRERMNSAIKEKLDYQDRLSKLEDWNVNLKKYYSEKIAKLEKQIIGDRQKWLSYSDDAKKASEKLKDIIQAKKLVDEKIKNEINKKKKEQ